MLGVYSPESLEEENANMLRRMAADGDSLINQRDIEFNHQFAHEDSAVEFLAAAKEKGYSRGSHEYWKEQVTWLTAIRIRMAPTLEKITEIELDLAEIASPFEGKPDGWGCMEVIKPQAT